MQKSNSIRAGHGNRTWAQPVVWAVALTAAGAAGALSADDSIDDLLGAAKPATAPATLTAPGAPEFLPTSGIVLTNKPPESSSLGTITLSDGTRFEGRIWTGANAPVRVWVEETKSYRDLDLALVRKIEVHVLSQAMEEDWRWLKEGSDQKVYSGKKYPSVSLAYKFTLLNGQQIEGTVVAAIYFADGTKSRTLALYKNYKGNLDDTFKDLIYISSITLDGGTPATQGERTTKLPLLEE
jgi:hypothetical protein